MAMQELSSEAILLAAAGRAILLQLADPAVGHGVATHSDFDARTMNRFHGTLSYVYTSTFGTPAQAARARRRVNAAHAPVHGEDDGRLPAYNAFSPELQLWVAATLYDSAVSVHDRVFGPLDTRKADVVYAEYAQIGTRLQMPRQLWPDDRASFASYWEGRLGELRTDVSTRAAAHRLLYPRNVPLPVRAAMPLARLLTTGLLPAGVRTLYDLPWTPRQDAAFARFWRVARNVYPVLPDAVRHWPRDHYLRRRSAA